MNSINKGILFYSTFFVLIIAFPITLFSQKTFSKQERLHGALTPLRTCFDVGYQDITVAIYPQTKSIQVQNKITFKVVDNFTKLQLDLFIQMQLDSILYNGKRLIYTRDSNAVFVQFFDKQLQGDISTLNIYAHGKPIIAKKAPWDGGFVWTKDDDGNDWVSLACEGLGASCWLPCKDHWSDEADSVDIHLQVPAKLVGVSNGTLEKTEILSTGFTQYDWKVRNPINNYNISVNVAKYESISDIYRSKEVTDTSTFKLTYYVLSKYKDVAKSHFKQTHNMLDAFEHYFGNYPFANDGYKLVQTPYWGMEHQSCVAYGNNFENNKWGFDFIIVHESGHEWFGNSLTANDPGDMWIHESFTTYSEALYVEYFQGLDQAQLYLESQQINIKNEFPLVGPYNVHFHGQTDNDIYYKGSWMLHTLRNGMDNDSLWFGLLKGFATTYAKKQLSSEDVILYFSAKTNQNLKPFFNQYLYTKDLPILEYKIDKTDDGRLIMSYRWKQAVKGFNLPLKVTVTKGKYDNITPTVNWQLIDLNYFDENDFMIKPNCYLIIVEKQKNISQNPK